MKKIYRIPTMELVELNTTPLLGSSKITGPTGSGGYGGVDNGTHDPSAPHHHYKEDEEDEEEEDW